MTDRLEQELDELLGSLQVKRVPAPPPPESITVACLYHTSDHQDWQRLAQHLEAVQWQVRQRCTLTWTTDEGNPKEPSHSAHMKKAAESIANAHIVIVGLSVDMQLLFQQQLPLYDTLFRKLEEARYAKDAWGHPPYVAGIRMKATLWDEIDLYGMEFLPRHQHLTLAGQHHRDTTCVEIARQVREWIDDILDERIHQMTKE